MRTEDGTWPLLDDPRDPWREPWPDDDLGWADLNASDWVDPRDQETYRGQALALQARLDQIRAGCSTDLRALRADAAAAGVSGEWRPDRRPAHVAPFRVDEHVLLRLANNYEPAAGLFGPDALLGPWVETFDPTSARDRRTLAYAVAHWACCHTSDRAPHHAFDVVEPLPPVADRAAVKAVERAPLSMWHARAESGAWRLTDLVGLHRRRLPDGVVSLDHAAGPGTLGDGAVVLARLVPVDGRWVAWAPLVLPATPTESQVYAWVLLELLTLRLRRRRSSLEDALRWRGQHLARSAMLWAYGARAHTEA